MQVWRFYQLGKLACFVLSGCQASSGATFDAAKSGRRSSDAEVAVVLGSAIMVSREPWYQESLAKLRGMPVNELFTTYRSGDATELVTIGNTSTELGSLDLESPAAEAVAGALNSRYISVEQYLADFAMRSDDLTEEAAVNYLEFTAHFVAEGGFTGGVTTLNETYAPPYLAQVLNTSLLVLASEGLGARTFDGVLTAEEALAANSALPNFPLYEACGSASSDPDGDGWGFENGKSCKAAAQGSGGVPICKNAKDTGDGWGFEDGKSCRIGKLQAPGLGTPAETTKSGTSAKDGIPPCSSADADSDGDGYGYENGKSCRSSGVGSTTSAQVAASGSIAAGGSAGTGAYSVSYFTRDGGDARCPPKDASISANKMIAVTENSQFFPGSCSPSTTGGEPDCTKGQGYTGACGQTIWVQAKAGSWDKGYIGTFCPAQHSNNKAKGDQNPCKAGAQHADIEESWYSQMGYTGADSFGSTTQGTARISTYEPGD